MIKRFASACVALSLMVVSPVWAQSSPVVVELYTSQGCSSCPPADALLHKLDKQDNVIPLALHVDYWDYIGWKDEYARPEHTQRQRGYAHFAGRSMIYTPQMIVNGQDDVVGARGSELADLIARHRSQKPTVAIEADRDGNSLIIRAEAIARRDPEPLMVQLVRYTPLRSVAITRGENAGRQLDYANVVDDWSVLGQWDGVEPLTLKTELNGELPGVVLIQQKGPGAIIAAARVK